MSVLKEQYVHLRNRGLRHYQAVNTLVTRTGLPEETVSRLLKSLDPRGAAKPCTHNGQAHRLRCGQCGEKLRDLTERERQPKRTIDYEPPPRYRRG